MKLPAFACCLSALTVAEPSPAQDARSATQGSRRIVNIVNFIRQCEPRIDWITEDVLYDTVVQQIKLMQRHKLRGTFLLQYDALMEPRYQKLLKELPEDDFEIGAWWEIMQPLVENSGYKWRGRYPWDWHADVGFATGYSPEEREKLVDTYMADFRKIFGRYPKSVGSWFIDAHTLKYMHDRYGIVASCNCKDQIGTDGYTMWGGYWNQGYYPSVKNAYMPAQTAANQIPVPIFRMLGSDPIHQYDRGLGTGRHRVISLEPVYLHGGGDPKWCDWYFDTFVNGAAMDFGYTQVGQENSFTWKRMAKGLEYQMPLVAKLRDAKKIEVRTLAETGQWFKQKYKVTPPTSVTVLKDYSPKDQKTVWFNSRFFRANLLWDKTTMRFRDIHLFDERIESDYLKKRGTSSRCLFDTLPVVDGFRWSTKEDVAGLRLRDRSGNELQGGTSTVDDSKPGTLIVRWPIKSDEKSEGELVITFTESKLTIATSADVHAGWYLELSHAAKAQLPFREVSDSKLSCTHRGTTYSVTASQGKFTSHNGRGWRLTPRDQRIVLDLSERTQD